MVKKILIKDGNIPNIKENVSCIGYFDGVHIGHQALIKETIKQANKLNVLSSLICFEPDPIEVITNKKCSHILSYQNRLNVIESFGINQIIIIKFTDKFMKLSPDKFIKDYLNKMNIKKLVCGYDFTFGYKGLGNTNLLKKNNKFEIIIIPEKKHLNKKVSSTRIKEAFTSGNFKLTNKLLGWDYCLELKVVNCAKQGKKWLIETKLKNSRGILPKDGKYGNGFEVKGNRVFILGPMKLNKKQLLLTSFSKDE